MLPADPIERANVLTHFPGIVFGLIGMFLLPAFSSVPVLIFTLSFNLMFFASSTYHWINDAERKKKWRTLDHVSIFVLIAGTYTPFLMTYLNNSKGYLILQILWACVLVGSILKIFFIDKFRVVSTIIYLIMGWMAIFAINDFLTFIPSSILSWIGLGGLFYTIGTLFYLWKKWAYHHAIWHVFVLSGAVSHWIGVYLSTL